MKGTGSCSDLSDTDKEKWAAEEIDAENVEAVEALRELILFPLKYSKEAKELGIKHWKRGLLLCGPFDNVKIMLVGAVVKKCGAHLILTRQLTVQRADPVESEKILREAFSEAISHTALGKPSVIFINRIDALCGRLDSRTEQNVHFTSLLISLIDNINKVSTFSGPQVVVVASADWAADVDPALRRHDRFGTEIEVSNSSHQLVSIGGCSQSK